MADEGKGIGLVILGIVAIVAVIGLVLLFTGASSAGRLVNPEPGVTAGAKSGYAPEGPDYYWTEEGEYAYNRPAAGATGPWRQEESPTPGKNPQQYYG